MNAALLKARQRAQAAMERDYGGSVSIGSTVYAAAVAVGEIRDEPQADGSGWRKVQTLTASILKTRLTAAPAEKTVLVFGGVNYYVDGVGGQNATDVAWVLRCQRRVS